MSVNASRSSSVAARMEYIDTYTSAIRYGDTLFSRRRGRSMTVRPTPIAAMLAHSSISVIRLVAPVLLRGCRRTAVDNRKDSLMMMQPSSLMRQPFVVLATVAMLLTAAGAQAQTVRFKTISDAVPLKYFNAATTAPDPSNPNRLIIGFNTGLDPTTFITNEFLATFGRS